MWPEARLNKKIHFNFFDCLVSTDEPVVQRLREILVSNLSLLKLNALCINFWKKKTSFVKAILFPQVTPFRITCFFVT